MTSQEMIIQRIIKAARVIASEFGVVASGSYVDNLRVALSDYDICIAEAYLESKGETLRMLGDGPYGSSGPSFKELDEAENDPIDKALDFAKQLRAEYGLHHASVEPSLEDRVSALESQMKSIMRSHVECKR